MKSMIGSGDYILVYKKKKCSKVLYFQWSDKFWFCIKKKSKLYKISDNEKNFSFIFHHKIHLILLL